MTAKKLLPISAAELVRAYPHDFGNFPPAIKFMIGQRVEFEVQLPKFSPSNPFGDFKICNISGLAIPRAEIIDNLPVPIAPRPLSPPSTHNTPMPGDPAYGNDGYHEMIRYNPLYVDPKRKRGFVSQNEYYNFRLQYRRVKGKTLIRSGKALQHFCIDAFTTIEQNRLIYLRLNQKKLRADLYN
ncbi:hypothetical protein LINPERPRIM_LOCUS19252, partial [Linum perenne]